MGCLCLWFSGHAESGGKRWLEAADGGRQCTEQAEKKSGQNAGDGDAGTDFQGECADGKGNRPAVEQDDGDDRGEQRAGQAGERAFLDETQLTAHRGRSRWPAGWPFPGRARRRRRRAC